MRVDSTNASPILPKALGATPPPAARAGDTPGAVGESESFAPSADLAALLVAVRQSPEVRADVIESAAAKLAAGAFDTPEAAADAARALLDSGDASPAT